ncbi:uncharacterized methyltransferase C25B8.09-like isoform X1 [Mizuhopecten yessoensis]|uniref:Methyltransferase C25B8.09 n=2 Tax=Mizuhopecten yessoensis TaxID=6573 RepID=A0A210Q5R6_MIZYE|nr:uncharacterized methyltransferase C25B8.09-like isoform X1 [Mizuhopecten yessoensis]OWF44077.1 methyltransferase C25B8.09 [Mizuhopecten yessoensis]
MLIRYPRRARLHQLKRTMSETANAMFKIVKEGFTDGSHYDKYRPDYTPETTSAILRMLTAEHGVSAGENCDILELGAGTGKLTKHLYKALPPDLKFVATEPMSEFLTTLRERCPGVTTVKCTADVIPFPDNSIQGIVAAQCFHWFANESALTEITRVLKPKGNLILVWNVPNTEVDWVDVLTKKALTFYNDDDPQYVRFWWKDAIDAFPGLGLKTRKLLDYTTSEYTIDDMKTFYSTTSTFASMSADDKEHALGELEKVVRSHPSTADKTILQYPRVTDLLQYIKQ